MSLATPATLFGPGFYSKWPASRRGDFVSSLFWTETAQVEDLAVQLRKQAGGVLEDGRKPTELTELSTTGEIFAHEAVALQRTMAFGHDTDLLSASKFCTPTARLALLAREPVGALLVCVRVFNPAPTTGGGAWLDSSFPDGAQSA